MGYEEKTVIHELTQGLQMAEQLRVNLHSHETRDFLLKKILSSYDKILSALQSGDSAGQPSPPALHAPCLPESSSISFGSPGSEEFEFDQPFWGRKGENVISKKRKGFITWEDEVTIWSDNYGLEGNTSDGYNWRKYGQKEIQGAKFPRSYYKCSYRNAQNCFATKQVQRKDENPTVFDVVYKGIHTCNKSASPSPSPSISPRPPAPPSHEKHEMLSNLRARLSVNTSDFGGDTGIVPSSFSFPSTSSSLSPSPSASSSISHQPRPPAPAPLPSSSPSLTPPLPPPSHEKHETLSNLRARLSVNTSDLDGDIGAIPSSFSFPATSSGSMEAYDQLHMPNFDDELFQVCSPPFISPVTSESNFFSEWGSSQSLDLLADVDTDFEFNSLFN